MSKNRPIEWKEFDKFLKFVGCEFKRSKGDHRIYSRQGLKRPIVVPRHNPLPLFVVRNNLRVLGMTLEDFYKIRKEI